METRKYRTVTRITAVLISIFATSIAVVPSPGQAQDSSGHRSLGDLPELFFTSDRCIACHSDQFTRSGEDVSIGYNWRSSMMANSSRDPYWQAAVRREVLDHPAAQAAIEDKCSTCHMPMSRFRAATAGQQGKVFRHLGVDLAAGADRGDILARDGVSCTVCHQIREDNFGEPESFTGGFRIDTTRASGDREIFGPFEIDAGRAEIMRSSARFTPTKGAHIQRSELCATCHTLYTHALDREGEVVAELPEQVPYLEWLHSEYRYTRSCQSCHMPVVEDSMQISSVLGQPRAGFSKHIFRGANAFMLRILNRDREEQGVAALPQEMDAAIRRTVEFLRTSTARVTLDSARLSGSRLQVDVVIENLAGHKLPTAYPSRRSWLQLTVRGGEGGTVFESGALRSDGSIVGNDNDADSSRYEPHYTRIDEPDQVQIYEPIMVDSEDEVTTGLLFGVRYIKDNRLLPRGFDKATAEYDVAVQGQAADDADFRGGGDRVRYVIDLAGRGPRTEDDGGSSARPERETYAVTAKLWYQSIGYRWAHNLEAHPAPETDRFVRYYEAMAGSSAVLIAGDSVRIAP